MHDNINGRSYGVPAAGVSRPWVDFIWTRRALDKLDAHGVIRREAEYVVVHASEVFRSRSSDRFVAVGYTRSQRRLVLVFEWVEPDWVVAPITAYEPEPMEYWS